MTIQTKAEDRVTVWPETTPSLVLRALNQAADDLIEVPPGVRLVEYETFPAGVVSQFDAQTTARADNTPEGFRRFASRSFSGFLAAVDSHGQGRSLVVPRAELRADPEAVLTAALLGLAPDIAFDRQKTARIVRHAVEWVMKQPAPKVQDFRYFEPKLFTLLGRLRLQRAAVRRVFSQTMGRDPAEAAYLNLQAQPTEADLEASLKRSREYRDKHPRAAPPVQSPGVSAKPALANGSGLLRFVGVSWPRSGHHMLVRLLQLYFGNSFGYCQFYGTDQTCCKTAPCTRHDIHLSKSHDFDLDLPQRSDRRYLIQYRDFLPSAVSNFELHVRSGGEDSRDSFLRLTSEDFGRYLGFIERWVRSPFAQDQTVLRYEDLLSDPERAFAEIVAQIDPTHAVDREAIRLAVRSVDGEKIEAGTVQRLDKSGVHKARELHDFRYYDRDEFALLARLRRPRAEAIKLAKKTFGPAPTEHDIIRAQALGPGE